MQQRHQPHRFGIVARRAQRLRQPGRALGVADQCAQRRRGGLTQRPRPGPQRQRRTTHPVHTEHGDGAPHGEHLAVTRRQRGVLQRAVGAAQQLEAQRQILQHHLGQLAGAPLVHGGQPRRPPVAAGCARQGARCVQAIEQQRERPAAGGRFAAQPAIERTFHAARAAVTLTRLPIGGAVGDGPQRLRHGPRGIPWQAHDVAPGRRQAVDLRPDVGLIQGRPACEHPVQQQADAQRVALCGLALRRKPQRVDVGLRRAGRVACARRQFQADDAQRRLLTDQQHVRLQIAVGDAAIVREGQAAQGLHAQRRCLLRRPCRPAQPLGQRARTRGVVEQVRPVLAAADLARRRKVRVLEARSAMHGFIPAAGRSGIARLLAGQQQQQRLPRRAQAQVSHPPRHRLPALSGQRQQFEHPEAARHGAGAGQGRQSRGRFHGGMTKTDPIGAPPGALRCPELRGDRHPDRRRNLAPASRAAWSRQQDSLCQNPRTASGPAAGAGGVIP
ncbi:MAG TPA: hypothetical protein PLB41_15405 [Rubrivivax sp.]|nr:hypothetical protein [Rubrivivax sp.]HPO19892.1 hypothetical protein [Rubrivivax sp.]